MNVPCPPKTQTEATKGGTGGWCPACHSPRLAPSSRPRAQALFTPVLISQKTRLILLLTEQCCAGRGKMCGRAISTPSVGDLSGSQEPRQADIFYSAPGRQTYAFVCHLLQYKC